MSSLSQILAKVAEDRALDPLAPVTFIVPSHIAGLQLRRRLAALGPFAAVRFETLPRIAELLGAARLAGSGKAPLARPIGDYAAQEVARQAGGDFASVSGLPGFGRVLRTVFRRLKRGGITSIDQAPAVATDPNMAELFRLYGLFQAMTAGFYDEEDLLLAAAAAVRDGNAGAMSDLGALYVLPPGAESAAAAALLEALERRVTALTKVDEAATDPVIGMVLAADPASEAHEVVREVANALAAGAAIDEIAIFHGADPGYPRLLREALARADIPVAAMPGVPLVETPAGRGVLALASLPETDFARAAIIDFLSVAPVRSRLPAGAGTVPALVSAWDRLSRVAGITHGLGRWRLGLTTLIGDRRADLENLGPGEEGRREALITEIGRAENLLAVVEHLAQLLEPLSLRQPAPAFIAAFKNVVRTYLRPDAGALEKVEAEIDQLGTVGAIGGEFSLESFTRALRANLETAVERDRSFGDGILVADYRLAAGLEFRHVIICGAHDGAFPAGPGPESLVSDATWRRLKERFPYIEDTESRLARARAAAARAMAATPGRLTWSVALNRTNAGGELYPAPQVVESAQGLDPLLATATSLRSAAERPWLRRARSPLGSFVAGTPVVPAEIGVRAALLDKRAGIVPADEHPLAGALRMLRARRGNAFSEWDGNLAGLAGDDWLALTRSISPTSLETYATCGFRYFSRSLLRLNVVEETEERETMDPAERGTLIHKVLHRFFREKQAEGRPRLKEAWTAADNSRLLAILDEQLGAARDRGRTGLDLYASYEARNIRADLTAFLEADTAFREETGAIPTGFEVGIPEIEIAGMRLRGYADRIDETPDGSATWVIDYKTGSASPFEGFTDANPLMGGTKLQLPVYLSAVASEAERHGLYWLISRRAGFEKKEYQPSARNQELFDATMAAIVGGISKGAFPVVPGDENEFFSSFTNCRFCEFTRMCSRRRDYEIVAKYDDPALAPWRAVALSAGGRVS